VATPPTRPRADAAIPKLNTWRASGPGGVSGKVRAITVAMATPGTRTSSPNKRQGHQSRRRQKSPRERCRAKFLRYFPNGYDDDTYVDWERDYKWRAHLEWKTQLGALELNRLLGEGECAEVARRAVRIESRTNLLFSFEKMALRDALKPAEGAEAFARGLRDWLHGPGPLEQRFSTWVATIDRLPRRQTRVLTWPLVTVFGFLAQPDRHIFLKPNVTRTAARAYDFPFHYVSRPAWDTYASLLEFAETVRRDTQDLHPRDMIDLQSFIWVQGSDEY
jgi:hypothetical protein